MAWPDATHSLSTQSHQPGGIKDMATGRTDDVRDRLRGVGALVRARRLDLALSQEELAHRAGLHRTYVGSVERGERNVSVANLYALADAMDVKAGELLPP